MAGSQRMKRSRGYILLRGLFSLSYKHSQLEYIYDSLLKSTRPFFLVKEIGGITEVGSIEQYEEFFAGVAPENVIRASCLMSQS
jgi:hypothetical protein